MRFRSGFDVVGQVPAFPQEVIREEPNLFAATAADVARHGGPIARAFVAALPDDFRAHGFRVRSKLQCLKRGWLPSGGAAPWHCDQVQPREDGEQDYQRGATPGRHTIGAAVGDVSLTRFLVGEDDLPDYADGTPQGLLWNAAIEDGLRRGEMSEAVIAEGALVRFGELDFHAPAAAIRTGWRLFIRATLDGSDRTADVRGWDRRARPRAPGRGAPAAASGGAGRRG